MPSPEKVVSSDPSTLWRVKASPYPASDPAVTRRSSAMRKTSPLNGVHPPPSPTVTRPLVPNEVSSPSLAPASGAPANARSMPVPAVASRDRHVDRLEDKFRHP